MARSDLVCVVYVSFVAAVSNTAWLASKPSPLVLISSLVHFVNFLLLGQTLSDSLASNGFILLTLILHEL